MKSPLLFLTLQITLTLGIAAADPIHLGSRRELFVDSFLIQSKDGVRRELHHLVPREVAIVHDEPWEGNISYYHTVFRDADLYRMYYRGGHSGPRDSHPEATGHQVVCYAESRDGIHWTKPRLGLHEFQGSRENNIIWTGIGQHNFAPFKDPNPDCAPEARYKALGSGKGGLYAFQSPDGIHWKLMHDRPVITRGAFDSQNLAFYDTVRGRYVDFHRGFKEGVRAIMTCTSSDFLQWTEPEWIGFEDERKEHLYTNQTLAYHRAPHIFMAFPKRFVPSRNPAHHRHSGVSDIVFMSSRDGETFHRWSQAFLRPGLQSERWVNRNNFVARGLVETRSPLPGVPDELSLYSIEGYYTGDDCRMRRFALRPDGFVSIAAPGKGGEFTTHPITFSIPAPDTPRTPRDEPPLPLDIESREPIHGTRSLSFEQPAILSLGGTRNLGKQATLAAAVRGVPAGHRRLFSTYNGGSTVPNELYFDFNSGSAILERDGNSIRFNYNGIHVGAEFSDIGDWSRDADPEAIHHLAATWDDGRIAIYFDGRQVASGGKPGAGDLVFNAGDLRFGEDFPPTSPANEPFQGFADDILVLRRTLSPEEIARLAQARDPLAILKPDDAGVLLSVEDPGTPFHDVLTADGRQVTTGPAAKAPGDVELRVNFSTSAAGSIRCEIRDGDGTPIPGFTLKDSDELFGDSLDRALSWNGSTELSPLAGKPIQLRFLLRDADLYALRFGR